MCVCERDELCVRDEVCEMSCVWDELCVRWVVVWDEWCEMSGVVSCLCEMCCVRWVVCEMSGVWCGMSCVWCDMTCVWWDKFCDVCVRERGGGRRRTTADDGGRRPAGCKRENKNPTVMWGINGKRWKNNLLHAVVYFNISWLNNNNLQLGYHHIMTCEQQIETRLWRSVPSLQSWLQWMEKNKNKKTGQQTRLFLSSSIWCFPAEPRNRCPARVATHDHSERRLFTEIGWLVFRAKQLLGIQTSAKKYGQTVGILMDTLHNLYWGPRRVYPFLMALQDGKAGSGELSSSLLKRITSPLSALILVEPKKLCCSIWNFWGSWLLAFWLSTALDRATFNRPARRHKSLRPCLASPALSPDRRAWGLRSACRSFPTWDAPRCSTWEGHETAPGSAWRTH